MTDLARLSAFRARCAESEHRIQRQAGTRTVGSDTVEQAKARIDRMLADWEAYRATLPEQFRGGVTEQIGFLREARGWL
jgi:hypothetical protein